MIKKTITIIILLAIVFLSICLWPSQTKKDIAFEVSKGQSLSTIAYNLKQDSLISFSKAFKVYAVLFDYDKKVRPGEYLLSNNMSYADILAKLSSGDVIYRKITIPEGLTVKEILEIVNNNDYLTGEVTLKLNEGFLLPETYFFVKGDSRNSIVEQMIVSMENALEDIWQNRAENKFITSKNDLLNLASIVEKETLIDSEKPIVASVYLNRLAKNMRLQADPTVIYGAQDYQGDITYKMLREVNEYNTYKINGLPKTPIANPGLESIKAVANPAETDYLYFVATGDGGHVFSKTYQQHKKNVQNYLNKIKGN